MLGLVVSRVTNAWVCWAVVIVDFASFLQIAGGTQPLQRGVAAVERLPGAGEGAGAECCLTLGSVDNHRNRVNCLRHKPLFQGAKRFDVVNVVF